MPPRHRAFLAAIEAGPSIRDYVYQHRADEGLREAYNTCITWIERFRSRHLEYATEYVFRQAQSSPANPTTIGTGSTPFLPYLRWAAFEAAKSAARHSSPDYAYYHKLAAKHDGHNGKNPTLAVERKILRRCCYHTLRALGDAALALPVPEREEAAA